MEAWTETAELILEFVENDYLLNLRERTQMKLKGPHGFPPGFPRVGDVVLMKENLPRGQ